MPYQREFANKANHADVVNSMEIQKSLESMRYKQDQTIEFNGSLAGHFIEATFMDSKVYHNKFIAIDGTNLPVIKDQSHPRSQLTYGQIGSVSVSIDEYLGLKEDTGFVDNFKIAALEHNYSANKYILPGENVVISPHRDPVSSFRYLVNQILYDWPVNNPAGNSYGDLVAGLYLDYLGKDDGKQQVIPIKSCPVCRCGPISVFITRSATACCFCGGDVYVADCLMLDKDFESDRSGTYAANRFMNTMEHLLLVNLISTPEGTVDGLSKTAFVFDGPLAVFGPPRWLHLPIMKYLDKVRKHVNAQGLPEPLVLGITKSGLVVDHFDRLSSMIPVNSIFCVDNDYKFKYIQPASGYSESHSYGQEFIYKTQKGSIICFSLPYTYPSKKHPDFELSKSSLSSYPILKNALAFINFFHSDRYKNALSPVTLAHNLTAFSAGPGHKAFLAMINNHSLILN